MKRSYRLKQRAKGQDRTRQKIINAAIELHQANGLSATSMSDIAARAGVGKVTVYRHFPDEAALVGACSGHYFRLHPFPDPEVWHGIQDPVERLRRGLYDTYAYHRATEAMIARVLPEARDHPVIAPYHAQWNHAAQVLAEPWPEPARGDARLKAALALALSFDTWRLLAREEGLTDEQALGLMMGLVRVAAP
jgi:AcrR family transcriptional regulator